MTHFQLHVKTRQHPSGFTIVELLITIVVIAILATLAVVSYNGIQTRAHNAALQSDLRNAATQLGTLNAIDGAYPSGSVVPGSLKTSGNNELQYTSDGTTFCLTATSPTPGTVAYHVDESGSVQEGACDGHIVGGSGSPAPSGWTAIATGRLHACGIKDEVAYCWGYNTSGQLGNGTTANSSTPVAVNTGAMSGAVTAIKANADQTCATTASGMYCWGYNGYGQLGNGTTASSSTPVAVNTGAMSGAVTSFTVGKDHACATTATGVYCWGYNNYGQLGNGTTTNSSTPVAVSAGSMSGAVTAIDAGGNHTCATTTSGVYCWGWNIYGQIGNGSTTNSSSPVAVSSAVMSGEATSLAAGYQHSCATTSGGTYCWGYGSSGQIGRGSTSNSLVPAAVNSSTMTSGVSSLAAGYFHACAIAADNAYCWGMNTSGQLGNGATTNSTVPVVVNTATVSGTIEGLAAGTNFTCATTLSNVYCWGSNAYGQLGNGTTTDSSVPVEISNVS